MKTLALVGAQWGDEGKGKIIDIMSEKADVVVRSQGGNNAGHTVVVGSETYKLNLIPSGILYKDTDCFVGCGVVVDPKVILREMDGLTNRGIQVARLKIDARAHVILPYHIALDELSESARGEFDIGTTKRGIGPCYMDKAERSGIRMCDFIDEEVFADKLKKNLEFKNALITKIYNGTALSFEEIFNEYSAYAKRLKPFVADTSALIYKAIKEDKSVLFEGAQGTLLDLDVGTYPYVTSSHPTAGGAATGSGVGPTLIKEVLGIAKAYTTRVGKGPFPTELFDATGDLIREKGFEFGTTTGRPRRCGWMDTVILRYSVRVNGITSLAVNKLDTLTGIKSLKICTGYKRGKEIVLDFPADLKTLAECEPQFIELPGWDEDITGAVSFDGLPANAKKYIEKIEELTGCRIAYVGVGPARNQNLKR